MSNLVVKSSRMPMILIILLGIFFGLGGIAMIINAALNGFKPVPLMLGALLLTTFAAVVFLVRRGSGMSVREFTDTGLVRNDGRQFAWSGLTQVVDKMAMRSNTKKGLWRTELQFEDSAAWLIPSKVSNWPEVRAYVDRLECPHVQEDA